MRCAFISYEDSVTIWAVYRKKSEIKANRNYDQGDEAAELEKMLQNTEIHNTGYSTKQN